MARSSSRPSWRNNASRQRASLKRSAMSTTQMYVGTTLKLFHRFNMTRPWSCARSLLAGRPFTGQRIAVFSRSRTCYWTTAQMPTQAISTKPHRSWPQRDQTALAQRGRCSPVVPDWTLQMCATNNSVCAPCILSSVDSRGGRNGATRR